MLCIGLKKFHGLIWNSRTCSQIAEEIRRRVKGPIPGHFVHNFQKDVKKVQSKESSAGFCQVGYCWLLHSGSGLFNKRINQLVLNHSKAFWWLQGLGYSYKNTYISKQKTVHFTKGVKDLLISDNFFYSVAEGKWNKTIKSVFM